MGSLEYHKDFGTLHPQFWGARTTTGIYVNVGSNELKLRVSSSVECRRSCYRKIRDEFR